MIVVVAAAVDDVVVAGEGILVVSKNVLIAVRAVDKCYAEIAGAVDTGTSADSCRRRLAVENIHRPRILEE